MAEVTNNEYDDLLTTDDSDERNALMRMLINTASANVPNFSFTRLEELPTLHEAITRPFSLPEYTEKITSAIVRYYGDDTQINMDGTIGMAYEYITGSLIDDIKKLNNLVASNDDLF